MSAASPHLSNLDKIGIATSRYAINFPDMSPLKFLLAALLGTSLLFAAAEAQDADAPPVAPEMREVSPGVFEIGKIHLDQKTRTVRFPGMLNLTDGIIEYLLVTEQGSTHESLLVGQIQPNDLHFAMLLLGAKGSGANHPSLGEAPPGPIDARYLKTAPKLKGDTVGISVQWKVDGAEKSAPVEDWIFNTEKKKPMERGPWIYNGSMFNDGIFLAQIEGAFAALVTYPSALINNPRQGSDNDAIWTVNGKAVPAVKTPVEITIQLLPEAPPNAP
jgi:hypothetical protein